MNITKKICDIEEIKDEIKKFLPQFLQEHNIDYNKPIKCLNPNHKDNVPSMSLWKQGQALHCFGCSVSYDIISLHSILDRAPMHGVGFVYDNVLKLAEKYGVHYETTDLTPEQIRLATISNAYNLAAELLITDTIYDDKLISSRGWDTSICKKHNIGSVKDIDRFMAILSENTGLTHQQLCHIAIDDRTFSSNNIVYTVFDHKNKVRGFIARDTKFVKGSAKPKCFITPNEFISGGQENRIIEKNILSTRYPRIFGIQEAVKNHTSRIDVFEGPGSWTQCAHNNYYNCISVLGTSINESLLNYLKDIGISNLNLVFDADKTGIRKAESIMNNVRIPDGMKLSVSEITFQESEYISGYKDVEDYIKIYGIEKYKQITPKDSFQLLLDHSSKQCNNVEDLCEKLIPMIILTDNRIKQSRMIHSLAQKAYVIDTSIDIQALETSISEEVQRQISIKSDKVKHSLLKKISSAQDIRDIQKIVKEANDLFIEQNKIDIRKRISNTSSSTKLVELLGTINSHMGSGNPGWITGFQNIDSLMISIPKKESNMIVFGDPHHGKSALVQAMCLSMAKETSNKKLSILYWAIDDSYELSVLRMISSISGLEKRIVGGMETNVSDTDRQKLKNAHELLYELMSEQRISIKDLSEISDHSMAVKWIQNTQHETGHDVILVVDAINDIPLSASCDYEKQDKVVGWLQDTASTLACNIFCTAHTRKRSFQQAGQSEPSPSDIKGNNRIEFAGKILVSVYNELHDLGPERSRHAWEKNGKLMPAIKVNFRKVKTFLGSKGIAWFKMDESCIKVEPTVEHHVFMNKSKTTENPFSIEASNEKDIEDLNEGVFVENAKSRIAL